MGRKGGVESPSSSSTLMENAIEEESSSSQQVGTEENTASSYDHHSKGVIENGELEVQCASPSPPHTDAAVNLATSNMKDATTFEQSVHTLFHHPFTSAFDNIDQNQAINNSARDAGDHGDGDGDDDDHSSLLPRSYKHRSYIDSPEAEKCANHHTSDDLSTENHYLSRRVGDGQMPHPLQGERAKSPHTSGSFFPIDDQHHRSNSISEMPVMVPPIVTRLEETLHFGTRLRCGVRLEHLDETVTGSEEESREESPEAADDDSNRNTDSFSFNDTHHHYMHGGEVGASGETEQTSEAQSMSPKTGEYTTQEYQPCEAPYDPFARHRYSALTNTEEIWKETVAAYSKAFKNRAAKKTTDSQWETSSAHQMDNESQKAVNPADSDGGPKPGSDGDGGSLWVVSSSTRRHPVEASASSSDGMANEYLLSHLLATYRRMMSGPARPCVANVDAISLEATSTCPSQQNSTLASLQSQGKETSESTISGGGDPWQDSKYTESGRSDLDKCQWHQPWNHQGLSLFELVLDSDEFASELRAEDPELIQFLREPTNIVRLAQLIVSEPPQFVLTMEEDDEAICIDDLRHVKLPLVAQDVFCTGSNLLCRRLVENQEALRILLSPLKREPPLDDRISARLANIWTALLNKCPEDVARSLAIWRDDIAAIDDKKVPSHLDQNAVTTEIPSSTQEAGSESSSIPPVTAFQDFGSLFLLHDDPLVALLLRHLGSDAMADVLRSLITIIPATTEPLITGRCFVLSRLVEQIGQSHYWDADAIGTIERSENIAAVIAQILGNAASVPDFESLLLNFISRGTISQLLRILCCGNPEIAKTACDLLSNLILRCEEFLSTGESRRTLTLPCSPLSASTPLMKPHGMMDSRSPQIHPGDNAPLDVVDTGVFSGMTCDASTSLDPLLQTSLCMETESTQSDLRLSTNALRAIREFTSQIAKEELQQAICRTLCPQVVAIRSYQRCRHRKGGDCNFRERGHCRAKAPSSSIYDCSHILAPHKRTSAEANTTPPNGRSKSSDDAEWGLTVTEAAPYYWEDFSLLVTQESEPPTKGGMRPLPQKLCVSNDASESTTSGSPGVPAEEADQAAGDIARKENQPVISSTEPPASEKKDEGGTVVKVDKDENLTNNDSSQDNQTSSAIHSQETVADEDRSDQHSLGDDAAVYFDRVARVELPQGIRPRVGTLCLSLVNLIYAIVRLHNQDTDSFGCRFVPPLVDLFFAYKWNSLLHNAIKQVLLCVIEQAVTFNGSVLEVIVTETSLIPQIVKLAKRQKRIRLETNVVVRRQKRARHKVGNVPQTFQIAESLIIKSSQMPKLAEVLNSVPGWSKTVLGEVDYYVSLMSEPLGGGTSSTRESLGICTTSFHQFPSSLSSSSSTCTLSSSDGEEDEGNDIDERRVVVNATRHDVLLGVRNRS